mmetsp:Transcript_2872/g.8747  ORF Transcript_2872/g.8747 Transcript_2872/m.8747 type:complete len:674 (+) Transcript_2872:44-2065(+)
MSDAAEAPAPAAPPVEVEMIDQDAEPPVDEAEEKPTETPTPSVRETKRLSRQDSNAIVEERRTVVGEQMYTITNPSVMSWKQVTYSVPVKDKETKQIKMRRLLHNVDGYIRPGELLFIMGPSGAGKSTMLDVIADRVKTGEILGQVNINGKPRDESFRRIASYVPQEDSHMGVLTVRETFNFSAQLAGVSNAEERSRFVIKVAKNLGLENALDTKIGNIFIPGISGGQKRRLSTGVELFKKPSILLCDEVTTGLDSAAAYGVMRHLRALANSGIAVAVTVHQPPSSLWALADNLLLLWKGELIYFGPVTKVVPHFAEAGYECPKLANPSDYVLELVNDDFEGERADGNMLVEHYKKSEIYANAMEVVNQYHPTPDTAPAASTEEAPKAAQPSHATSLFQQFVVLTKRSALNQMRNPGLVWIRLAMYAMLSIMAATQFADMGDTFETILQREALLYYIQAFMVFMSIAATPFFIELKAVFLRERANNHYAPGPFVLANFVTTIPAIFLIAFVSSVIMYWSIGLHSGFDRFLVFLLCLYISLLIAEGVVYFVSALTPAFIIAIAVVAGIYGAFMLVEGFFKVAGDISWVFKWMHYIAFHTYSFRIFMYNEFKDLSLTPMDLGGGQSTYSSGNQVLEEFDMEDAKMGVDFIVLLVNVFVFQYAFYLALKYFHTGRR